MLATSNGFMYDRHFMLWDVVKSEAMHIGLRSHLCLFETSFDDFDHPICVQVTYGLTHAFDRPTEAVSAVALSIPLHPDCGALDKVKISMHKNPTSAFDMGHKYNQWFTDRLGYSVKLLYIGNFRRRVLGNLPPKTRTKFFSIVNTFSAVVVVGSVLLLLLRQLQGLALFFLSGSTALLINKNPSLLASTGLKIARKKEGITFADLAPFLIISKKSHENTEQKLPGGQSLDITKFRANIVIDGAKEAFEEDFWAELRIGDSAQISLTQNCARCNSLNVDFTTGRIATGETGKILKILSKDRRVDPGTKWSPVFGRYGFLTKGQDSAGAVLHVGDRVNIVARNQARAIMGEFKVLPEPQSRRACWWLRRASQGGMVMHHFKTLLTRLRLPKVV